MKKYALAFFLFLAFPVYAFAESAYIHISDTHVSQDGSHQTQNDKLKNWVDFANSLGNGKIKYALSTGDLADSVNQPADLQYYFDQTANLAIPHLEIPGNHDYHSSKGLSYESLGYLAEKEAVVDDILFCGTRPSNKGIRFDKLEECLKKGAGRYRTVILQHYPTRVPASISCGGKPCTGNDWVIDSASLAALKNLITKYDAEAVISGHIHVTYSLVDNERFFNQLNAGDLPGSNRSAILMNYNDKLSLTDNKTGNPPLAFVSPVRYDSENGYGTILTNQPIRVKYLGTKTLKGIYYTVAGSSETALNNVENDWWEANYDWTKLSRSYLYTLKIIARFTDNSSVETSQPVRVSYSYPNQPTSVSSDDQYLNGSSLKGIVNLNFSFKDDATDVIEAEIFIDGARRIYKKYANAASGQLSYNWDTDAEKSGSHIVRFKTTDRFGRKQYTQRYEVFSGTQSISPTAVPTVAPTPILTLTPAVTPTSAITPIAAVCPAGNYSVKKYFSGSGNSDTYFYSGSTSSAEDKTPYSATVLKNSGYSPYYRTILKTDVSDISQDATVNSAYLKLTVQSWYNKDNVKPALNYAKLGKETDDKVSWTSANSYLNWTIAGAKAENSDYLSVKKAASISWGLNSIDVTDFVRSWVKKDTVNNGIILWEDDGRMAHFYSSDYTIDTSKRPVMEINYTCP